MSGLDVEVVREAFDRLGIRLLERGWLSSNNVVFSPAEGGPVTVVDTGYSSHSELTVELVRSAAGPWPVERVVNTHLHSDHCGGNTALQAAMGCEVWVPEASFAAVRDWDSERLSFQRTDQRCERFVAERAIAAGSSIELGGRAWLALAAPGHDPDALVFYQPEERVLISGDALWEGRLAVIFPELEGQHGFAQARAALDLIEGLGPRVVIPGHGRAFTDVASALRWARSRLDQFEAQPERHYLHSVRVLVMFHLLEFRRRKVEALVDWLQRTPIFAHGLERFGGAKSPEVLAMEVIDRLVFSGALRRDGDSLVVVES